MKSTKRSAFTLTELLIVISIIVLVLAMALPAFKFITGSRSVEGAQNQIASLIGQTRSEAVGLQEMRGVLFYLDPVTDRVKAAPVRQADAPTGNGSDYIHAPGGGVDQVDVYLDLVSDSDPVILPGVSMQMLDNWDPAFPTTGNDPDKYIGYNTYGRTGTANNATQAAQAPAVQWGGAVVFDSVGRIVSLRFGLRTRQFNPNTNAFVATEMGNLLYRSVGVDPATVADFLPWSSGNFALRSSVGFALFDRTAFDSQRFSPGDTQIDPNLNSGSYTTGTPNEQTEETWLDSNTTPLLVGRYTGTLLKGE